MGVENKDRLVRYWLGSLPEAERLRLEKECLAHEQLSEALKEAENDLIDSYVCGELSQEQRLQFEQNYLNSPEKHQQLEMARLLMDPALRQRIAATAVPIRQEAHSWSRWWAFFFQSGNLTVRLGTAAAGIALAALMLFLTIQNHRLRAELGRLQVEQAKLHQQIAELQQNLNVTGSDGQIGAAPVLVSVLLKSGLSRKGGSANGNNRLRVPASALSVMLLLDLPNDRYSRYNVVVETVEGKTIERIQGLNSKSAGDGRIIAVSLPAQAFASGDYVVTLFGGNSNSPLQAVDSYTFSVFR